MATFVATNSLTLAGPHLIHTQTAILIMRSAYPGLDPAADVRLVGIQHLPGNVVQTTMCLILIFNLVAAVLADIKSN